MCGVDKLLDVFSMEFGLAAQHLQGPLFHLGLQEEWVLFMNAVRDRMRLVEAMTNERSGIMSSREMAMVNLLQIRPVPNLVDAFKAVPKDQFPLVWRFLVRTLTILPTTVACEQSFRYLKRTLHANMSETTAKFFLFSRLSLYNYNYDL